jgi:hypothetical protein
MKSKPEKRDPKESRSGIALALQGLPARYQTQTMLCPGQRRPGRQMRSLNGQGSICRATGPCAGRARTVFRKTELLGIAPPTEPDAIKKARQRTLKNIRDPDGEVAYRPFEDAFRDFTCSLVQRQDKVYDEMLLYVADLQQRIDALECQIEEIRNASPGSMEVKR